MADEPSASSYYGLGLSNTQPTEQAPTQGLGGRLRDVALDTTRGVVGIARDVGGLRELGAVSPEQKQQARADMDEMGKIDYWLRRGKSEAGRYRDEHPGAKTLVDQGQDLLTGILPYAPLAATGPASPFLFGSLALGHQRVELRDRLRDMSDEELAQVPDYVNARQGGKSHQEAIDAMYEAGTDPTKLETWKNAAPAVIGNVIGGGAIGLMTKGAMRTLSGTITDRVLSNVNQGAGVGNWAGRKAIGGATGAVGGAAMGGGGTYTRQATEQAAGIRPQGVDMGDVWHEGATTGAIFGAIGAATHGRQTAPPIGTDTVTVARMQEAGYGGPGGRAIGPVQPHISGRPGMGGREIEAKDIYDELGYAQPPGTEAQLPPGQVRLPPGTTGTGAPAVPMSPRDAAYMHDEYGHTEWEPGAPGAGGRPMELADMQDPYGYEQPSGVEAQQWTPPPPPKPLPPPGGGGGRRQMRQGDIMDEMGPAGPRVVGRTINERDMVQGDIMGEYGPEGARMARRPVRGRPMQQGDLYGEYGPEGPVGPMPPPPRSQTGWRPWEPGEREMTGADIGVSAEEHGGWAPPSEPTGPYPTEPRPFPEGGERPSAQGPAPKRPPRGGRGDGGAGGPPRGGPPPPRGGAPEGGREAAPPRGETEMRAPHVSAAEFGGERAEPELPYPERATMRKHLARISPEIRGAWARKMADALEHGQSPLDAIPMIGQRMLGEHITNLMRDHPRGVVAEISRGVREVPREATGLSTGEHGTLRRLMEKGTPEERAKWAAALEDGKKYVWAKMPKSWKDAVKGMEKDVHDLVTKNSRAVIDELRPKEARYEEAPYEPEPMREAEAADIGAYTPTPEGERRGEPTQREEKAEGKEEYESYQEAQPGRFRPSEYGPEIEPGEDYGQKPYRPQRKRVAETVGLTRRGEYAPGTRGRMLQQAGFPLKGTAATRRAGEGRLAPAPALQRAMDRAQAARKGVQLPAFRAEPSEVVGGFRRGTPEPTPPFAGPEPETEISSRWTPAGAVLLRRLRASDEVAAERARQRREAEEAPLTQEQRERDRQRDVAEAERIMHEAMNTPGMQALSEVVRRDMERRAGEIAKRIPDMNADAKEVSAANPEAQRGRDRRAPDYQAREEMLERTIKKPGMGLKDIPADFFEKMESEKTGSKQTMEQWLDEVASPAGIQRPVMHREELANAARRIASLLAYHVEVGDTALRRLYNQRYPAGSKRQPQVNFQIGTHISGRYPWFDLLNDFKSRAAMLAKTADRLVGAEGRQGPTGTGGRVQTAFTLRTQMLNAYMRVRLLAEGKPEEIRELDKQLDNVLYEDMQADVIKQRQNIDEYNRVNTMLQEAIERQRVAGGRHSKRGAKIQAEIDSLAARKSKMPSAEASEARLAEISKEQLWREEMQRETGGVWQDPAVTASTREARAGGRNQHFQSFVDNAHDFIESLDVQDNQKKALISFFREQFPSELSTEDRIDLQRGRQSGMGDVVEQRLTDQGRTQEQIDAAKEQITKQEAELKLKLTTDQARQRIADNTDRVEALVEARAAMPDRLTAGNIRQAIDTMRYYLRTATDPMRMADETLGPHITTMHDVVESKRVEVTVVDRSFRDWEHIEPDMELTQHAHDLAQRVDSEIARLQDETRRLWELITPESVNWDYNTGRVLDPAANLRAAPKPMARARVIADYPRYEEEAQLEGRSADERQSMRHAFRARELSPQEAPREVIRGGKAVIIQSPKSWIPEVRGTPLQEPPALPRGAEVHKLADFLDGERSIRPVDPKSVRGKLLNHFLNIVDRVSGDVDVVVLTPEQYQLVRDKRGIGDGDHPAFYDQATHRIFTTKDVANGPNRARILGHEFFHPLTVAAVERFPEIGARLDAIRKEVLNAYMEPTGRTIGGEYRPNAVQEILRGRTQGITGSVHEFITELYNDDGSLFSALGSMRARPELREQLRTDERTSMLSRAIRIIQEGFMKLFMQQNKNRLLNDAVIHSLDLFHSIQEGGAARPTSKAEVHRFTAEDATDVAKNMIGRAKYTWTQRGGVSGNFLRWHDLNQLGRRAEAGFKDVVAPFERIVNQVYSTTRSIIEKSGTPEMLQRLAVMSRLPAERWREFSDYINDENYAGLSGAHPLVEHNSAGERVGENKWVSEDAEGHAQMRSQHADLNARWQRLSPEMKAMRNEILDFSRRRHGEILNANINRVIAAKKLAEGDPAKAAAIRKYILQDELTPFERGKLNEIEGFDKENSPFHKWIDEVRSIPAFKKLPGVWYPMFRRGQWVTEGIFNLAKHANAAGGQEKARGEWEFETPEARSDFMRRMAADPAMQGVKLLRSRDVGYEKDPATGDIKLTDGKPTRTKRSKDSVNRYRAEYNPLLLEFHDSKFNAAQRHADIKAKYGNDIDMTHVEPVRDRQHTYLPETKATAAMAAMKRSLQHSEGWENMTSVERSQMERDLDDAAIRHVMSSTARATYLPRRYALGADKDLIKNFLQYGNNTARTLAETMHHEEIRAQVQKLDKYVEDHKRSGSPGDPEGRYGTLRKQIQNQIHSVLAEHPDPNAAPMWKKGLARALQVSYIDRLVSPSFLLLNASEPWVLGLPLLAGHHGMINSAREIGRAYKTVAALKLMAKGGADFKDVVKGAITGSDVSLSDNLQLLRKSIEHETDAKDLNKLLDYVDQHGYFDRNAGMELEQMFNPDAGRLGRIADYTDNSFRQINNQVENINRGVTGIASYRLGIQKGWSHEKSMEHAKDMMHDVNGNYAAHASPAVFRNPWLKPALQFKRYGHRIVSNYVRLIATSFGRNVKGEDRAVAMKQLAYWTAANVAASGVLGLPTEPIKAVVNGLHLAGITNFNFDDVEYMVRNAASDAVGPELGMALTRGVLRNAGLGIGTRMGYDTLVTSGNIESWKEVPGALFKMFGGSPASMAMDIGEGTTAGVRGLINWSQGFDSQADRDFGEFIEKGVPVKAAGDVYRAWSQAVGGRKAETKGGQPLGYDPTAVETALAALGIRSAREQEASDFRKEFYTKQRRYNEEKNSILTAYAVADTQAEKMRVLNHVVQNINPTLPPELKITVRQLADADARRRQHANQPDQNMGLPINKRTRALLPRPDVYNAQ